MGAQVFSSGSLEAGHSLVLFCRGVNTAVNCQQYGNYGGHIGPLEKVHFIADQLFCGPVFLGFKEDPVSRVHSLSGSILLYKNNLVSIFFV